MMNEIPEGFEIVEARNMHDLKVGDMLGGIVVKKIDGGLTLRLDTGAAITCAWEQCIALAAANYRVLRKLPPPEPVVLECEITVPFERQATIDTYGLYKTLRLHPGKKFNAVLTEIQRPA